MQARTPAHTHYDLLLFSGGSWAAANICLLSNSYNKYSCLLINQHFSPNFFLVFMNEEIVMMVSGLSSGHMSRSVVEAGLAGKILWL